MLCSAEQAGHKNPDHSLHSDTHDTHTQYTLSVYVILKDALFAIVWKKNITVNQ